MQYCIYKNYKTKRMNNFELVKTKDDHYRLMINGVDVTGEQERSVFRHLIETIDNSIYQY